MIWPTPMLFSHLLYRFSLSELPFCCGQRPFLSGLRLRRGVWGSVSVCLVCPPSTACSAHTSLHQCHLSRGTVCMMSHSPASPFSDFFFPPCRLWNCSLLYTLALNGYAERLRWVHHTLSFQKLPGSCLPSQFAFIGSRHFLSKCFFSLECLLRHLLNISSIWKAWFCFASLCFVLQLCLEWTWNSG